MPNYNFRKDLPIAQNTEHEIALLLTNLYGAEILEFSHDNRYDILAKMPANIGTFSFEVKEDFTCEKTGNIGLEFECRGKPSGIAVSQADFYIYKMHTPTNGIQIILISTNKLKRMIRENKYFRIVNGGDKDSNSMNYLFKLAVFSTFGKIIG